MCQEQTIAGLQAMLEAHSAGASHDIPSPFRFIYMSGTAAERDQTKTPSFMPQYTLMRVSTKHAPQVPTVEANGSGKL